MALKTHRPVLSNVTNQPYLMEVGDFGTRDTLRLLKVARLRRRRSFFVGLPSRLAGDEVRVDGQQQGHNEEGAGVAKHRGRGQTCC